MIAKFVSSNIIAGPFSFKTLRWGCKPSNKYCLPVELTSHQIFHVKGQMQTSSGQNSSMQRQITYACPISIQSGSNSGKWHYNGIFHFFLSTPLMEGRFQQPRFLLSTPLKFASKGFKISSPPLKKFPDRPCVRGCPPLGGRVRIKNGMFQICSLQIVGTVLHHF